MTLNAELVTALTAIPAFGGRVGKDRVGEGEVLPYVTYAPDIDSAVLLSGDNYALGYRVTFQVDLWENADDEDVALRDAVRDAIDGLNVRASGEGALRCRVRFWTRVPDPDAGISHRAFTVDIVHLAHL